MISISHLFKSFKDQLVLDDINLDIKEGEIIAILGESGSGKTVLLKHLIGLLKPDKGSIMIDDVDITHQTERELLKIRKNIGYLFQEGALYDFMNVLENVAFPLKEHTNYDNKTILKKVNDILSIVDLEGVENKFPSELSGGMRKRVGLARAVILDSKIIFCDEPTSGLDPIRSHDISNLIKNVSRRLNSTTVITSHDLQNSFRIADRLVLIQNGKIIASGSKEELIASENPFVKEYFN